MSIQNISVDLIDYTKSEWDSKCDLIQESISDIGYLLNPLTVRPSGERFKLEAGRRRLLAVIKLGWKEVPCLVLADNTTADIAMHENLMRNQLPWPEEVAMLADFHKKKQEQHGERKSGRPQKLEDGTILKQPGWSYADTANALSKSVGTVHSDIQLANALEQNPHLAKVRDKSTAKRLMKQVTERVDREAMAGIDLHDFEWNVALNGPAADVMALLPEDLFDAVITDPPWSVYQKDVKMTADKQTVDVFAQIYRTLKPGGFLYMVVSTKDWIMWTPMLEKLGFQVQQYPLIWHKKGMLTRGRRVWEYARDFEPIILAVKGDAMLTSARESSSILDFPAMSHHHMIHPHEKPIGLIKRLILDSTFDNGTVCDPFAGSGVLAQAAMETNRRFVVIERDPEFYMNIKKRIAGEKVEYHASTTENVGNDD